MVSPNVENPVTLDKQRSYTPAAKVFHWVTAFLILFQFVMAWIMTDSDILNVEHRMLGYTLHKSFGIVVLLLTILRIEWRSKHPAPPLPNTLPPLEKLATRVVHVALYIFLILIPLSGWVLVSTSAFKTMIFGLIPLPGIPFVHDRGVAFFLADHAGAIHGALASILLGLVVMHAGAALWHHFIKHDAILLRMTPRRMLPLLEKLRGPRR